MVGQSAWNSPQEVGLYRACINQCMATVLCSLLGDHRIILTGWFSKWFGYVYSWRFRDVETVTLLGTNISHLGKTKSIFNIPPWENEKHLQKWFLMGHVSSQEGKLSSSLEHRFFWGTRRVFCLIKGCCCICPYDFHGRLKQVKCCHTQRECIFETRMRVICCYLTWMRSCPSQRNMIGSPPKFCRQRVRSTTCGWQHHWDQGFRAVLVETHQGGRKGWQLGRQDQHQQGEG